MIKASKTFSDWAFFMIFSKKLLLLSVLFLACLVQANHLIDPQEFHLCMIAMPSQEAITKEQKLLEARIFKKNITRVTIVVGLCAICFVAYQVHDACNQRAANLYKDQVRNYNDVQELKKMIQNLQPRLDQLKSDRSNDSISVPMPTVVSQNSQDGVFKKAFSGLKSFGWGTSKFISDNILMLAGATTVNAFSNYVKDQFNKTYVDETILWYAHEQTQVFNLMNDLKKYAVDYDLYGSLLSADTFNQDAQVYLKSFVQDLVGAVDNHLKNEIFVDKGYFDFLIQDLKKKYVRKGVELEKLQEYVVPAIAKIHRAKITEQGAWLFTTDMNRRADIVHMCNMLSAEMQRLIAFVELRAGFAQKARVEAIVLSFNGFIEHMQELLNATAQELVDLSKANCGMFTCVYEYEKLFAEQMNFLHRYAKFNY